MLRGWAISTQTRIKLLLAASTYVRFPFTQIARFLTTGTLATLTHASVGYALALLTDMSGSMSNVCGFLSAWWVSFMGHFYFSFGGHSQGWAAVRRFVIWSALIFATSHSLTVIVSIHKMLRDDFIPIIGAVLTPSISFVVYKFIVFRYFGVRE